MHSHRGVWQGGRVAVVLGARSRRQRPRRWAAHKLHAGAPSLWLGEDRPGVPPPSTHAPAALIVESYLHDSVAC